jgi:hypothetical protein
MTIRHFTPEQLAAIGIPDIWTATDKANAAERLHEEQIDTRRWVSVHELVFRAPDDGKTYSVTYEQGLTEAQDDTDPWNFDSEIKATEVEERPVVTQRWLPVDAPLDPGLDLALLAEVRRLNAELDHARALAADATEYRIPLPESGGTTLVVRRQSLINGTGWAVSVPAHGGGRAWTTEGWQESISALSVDRLFCWPDAMTAVTEARRALAERPASPSS